MSKKDELPTFNVQLPTFNDGSSSVRERKPMTRAFDLQQRLLQYAVNIIRLVESLPNTRAANHVGGQLLRCGTSPLPNHGEAQAAESVEDFVHKMSVCLKELRESLRWLLLTKLVPLVTTPVLVIELIAETDELIRIFHSSIQTARRRAASRTKE
jgi:four helix bundle protein